MFEYEFPLFAVVREFTTNPQQPLNLSFHDIIKLSAPNRPDAIAIFTDRAAAEQFRDEHAAQHQIFEIPTPGALVAMLQAAKPVAGAVAFDPYRVGKGAQTSSIDDIIAFWLNPPSTPDSGKPE